MKPYQIGSTWVDLDQVQMIEDHTLDYPGYPSYGRFKLVGSAWQNDMDREMTRVALPQSLGTESVAREWEAFKTVWKTKDTMFGGSR